MTQPRWIVSQIGARQHYGVPRGFNYKRQLRSFYTDVWCRWGSRLVQRSGSTRLRAFGKRFHPHLPSRLVVSFTASSIFQTLRKPEPTSVDELFNFYSRQGEWFAGRVAKHLARQQLDPAVDHFFGFDSASLETLQQLKSRGIFCVVDQIDPGRTEQEIVHAEEQKWPGWQHLTGSIPEIYFRRLDQEWSLADMVLVNSEWSKGALVRQGVPAEKICIAPLPYEPESVYVRPKPQRDGPLRVLWLGTVNLRKGIQYLVEAARDLTQTDVKFLIAGPLEISPEAVATAPKNVEFLGRITRDRTQQIYREADVFVLPTLSDGFAITQLEAMGYGLPVITTPNCGQVVSDGADGFVVPAGNGKALAEAVAKLDADRKLLHNMSAEAINKVARYRLPNQSDEINAEVARRRGF